MIGSSADRTVPVKETENNGMMDEPQISQIAQITTNDETKKEV